MSVFNTLIVRAAQKAKRAYSGVHGISEQDVLLQQSMGLILDRTRERLPSTVQDPKVWGKQKIEHVAGKPVYSV